MSGDGEAQRTAPSLGRHIIAGDIAKHGPDPSTRDNLKRQQPAASSCSIPQGIAVHDHSEPSQAVVGIGGVAANAKHRPKCRRLAISVICREAASGRNYSHRTGGQECGQWRVREYQSLREPQIERQQREYSSPSFCERSRCAASIQRSSYPARRVSLSGHVRRSQRLPWLSREAYGGTGLTIPSGWHSGRMVWGVRLRAVRARYFPAHGPATSRTASRPPHSSTGYTGRHHR